MNRQPPEDICYRQLQKKHYLTHLKCIKTATSMTDTKPPASFLLNHLKKRGKRDQLRKDRLDHIAKTDRLLKHDIETIMFTERPQPGFIPMESLNARERLREVAYLDKNNKHMHERLHKTGPSVVSREKMALDFDKHLEQSYLMRRKHFGVLPSTPIKKPVTRFSRDQKGSPTSSLKSGSKRCQAASKNQGSVEEGSHLCSEDSQSQTEAADEPS